MRFLSFTHTVGLAILLSWLSVNLQAASGRGGKQKPRVTETLSQTQITQELQRNREQTSFLSAEPHSPNIMKYAMGGAGGLEAAPAMALADAGGTEKRDIVFSDVFGFDGEGKLMLLNNYRGLQTVDALKLELLGRSAASGNQPQDMYIDKQRHRAIVIERDYQLRFDAQGSAKNQVKTHLLVYDIRSSDPKLIQDLPVEGYVADSRLVGDVLYVASAIYEQASYWQQASDDKSKGRITSFSIAGETIKAIQSYDLKLPQTSPEMMRIVETPVGPSKYTYHLLAMLPGDPPEGESWFWNRATDVEVVDITDPTGTISHVMQVTARGRVNRPNMMTLRDNNLIVVSNYEENPTADVRDRKGRIAVEAFAFPTKETKSLPGKELDFRRLNLERELARAANAGDARPSAEALVGIKNRLLDDSALGLRGRFFRDGEKLVKVVPDSGDTRGDTTGLSASLRDARFITRADGNLGILGFWVPATEVDPCDSWVFKDGKIQYLTRLFFDGWVEHAEPIVFQGKTYVVALGFIRPSGQENASRHITSMLFEVDESGAEKQVVKIADLTIEHPNLWANLQAEDKLFDFRVNSEAGDDYVRGLAIREKQLRGGAKLVGFDLAAAASGKEKASLRKEVSSQANLAPSDGRLSHSEDLNGLSSRTRSFATL